MRVWERCSGKTVLEIEFLGDEDDDDGLSQTDNVGEEKAAMLFQQAEAARHRIHLVGEPFEALRHVGEGVGVVFDARAEVLKQKLEVEFVGRDRGGQVGAVPDLGQKLGENLDRFRPEPLELTRGVLHLVEVVKQDVELVVAAVFVRPDACAGQVG